jgi:hypothetical protein
LKLSLKNGIAATQEKNVKNGLLRQQIFNDQKITRDIHSNKFVV